MAEAVQHDLERAIGFGIPLERIEGVGAYLQGIAGRNPDLGVLALTGADGALLQGALGGASATAQGPSPETGRPNAGTLAALAAALRGLPTPETRAATLQPIEQDGFLILRLPVRVGRYSSEGGGGGVSQPPAGHVLVGVQPGDVRGQIAGELVTVALGALGVLLLVAELAGVLVRAGFRAPLRRLAGVMDEASAGRFATLIGRRPRDQVGRLLFAFNAVVYGLHDRRQRFAAHAEEVRTAVFDPEVAAAVERTRSEALAALGPGLEATPRRVVDARADDVHAFATLATAAAVLLALGGAATTPGAAWTGPLGLGLAALAAALAGAGAGYAVAARWRRWAALLTMATTVVAAVLLLEGVAAAGLLPGALCAGLAAGLSLSYRRRQVGPGAGGGVVARALASGAVAAILWGAATGWDGATLAASALVPALLAALMARSIVVPRS
ncbi:hypothetical protein TSO352_08310 [Azospirillum sp. TSO35-2]|nr:hypothetical protein TSO352_08310 [Azospirillum sp. TSO35-2]